MTRRGFVCRLDLHSDRERGFGQGQRRRFADEPPSTTAVWARARPCELPRALDQQLEVGEACPNHHPGASSCCSCLRREVHKEQHSWTLPEHNMDHGVGQVREERWGALSRADTLWSWCLHRGIRRHLFRPLRAAKDKERHGGRNPVPVRRPQKESRLSKHGKALPYIFPHKQNPNPQVGELCLSIRPCSQVGVQELGWALAAGLPWPPWGSFQALWVSPPHVHCCR